MVINDKKFLVGNYYGNNVDCPDHLEEYLTLMTPDDGQEIISAGDYNFVMNVMMDKRGGQPRTNEKSRKLMTNWCTEVEAIDVWRVKHPDTFDYTWRSWAPPFVYCRLDYFIISGSLCTLVDDCCIKNSFMSDHRGVTLEINCNTRSRGPGFWKLNNSLLGDKEYAKIIKKTILDALIENEGATPTLMFDTIKCRVRGVSVKYSAHKKRLNKDKIEMWSDSLSLLQQQLANVNIPCKKDELLAEISELSGRLERLVDETTKGAILRSRCLDYEEGERNSKYFYNLEKLNGNKKAIHKLNTETGMISEPKDILEEEVRFYTKLYSTSTTQFDKKTRERVFKQFLSLEHPKIDLNDAPELTADITEDEVFDILKSFSDNKSPGSDGLTKEFYVFFWDIIKKPLLDSFVFSLRMGSLSMDQRKGIISLIPKKDKDTTYLKNWRPLTLLNTDYKILAKLLAYRIKYLLKEIIHSDQTGFMPNRYIGCNINKIMNLMDYCSDNSIEGMLVAIDFEKAFDSMEWDFVYRCMENFGFPLQFINWIRTLYNGIESCVVNNGHISSFFKPTRGVRQGCPISPYLFIIGAEMLAMYVRQCEAIPVIPVSKHSTVISQYADDTNIVTYRSNTILANLMDILYNFSIISGLKVNQGKTQIMNIGCNLNRFYGMDDTCKVTSSIYILGIHISCSKKTMISENFTPILQKIKQSLNIWSQRRLSILGQI